MLYALIVGCEIGFWIILLLALALRYLHRNEPVSRALLLCLPLIDVFLLVFTALDLRAGSTSTFAHGLAAAYIGFTIAFGGLVVQWADAHFAHLFVDGPKPERAPTRGWDLVHYDLGLWVRCIIACIVTVALIEVLARFVDNGDAAAVLRTWHKTAFGCVLLWFVFGPAWSLATAWRPK
ncbi:MAG: hypothetical protein R3E77_16640 [Steroidobacteraceae bacterium]